MPRGVDSIHNTNSISENLHISSKFSSWQLSSYSILLLHLFIKGDKLNPP